MSSPFLLGSALEICSDIQALRQRFGLVSFSSRFSARDAFSYIGIRPEIPSDTGNRPEIPSDRGMVQFISAVFSGIDGDRRAMGEPGRPKAAVVLTFDERNQLNRWAREPP